MFFELVAQCVGHGVVRLWSLVLVLCVFGVVRLWSLFVWQLCGRTLRNGAMAESDVCRVRSHALSE